MEYAPGGGATTSRYYGETEDLLAKYAWYEKNSESKTWPVGSLKPNDLGLFDVQGNVYPTFRETKIAISSNSSPQDRLDSRSSRWLIRAPTRLISSSSRLVPLGSLHATSR